MEDMKPEITVEQVEDSKEVVKTPKQIAKEKKKQEEYLNKMITRREAYEMIHEITQYSLQSEQEKLRILFIQIETLTQVILDKCGVTREELDELSKPIIEKIYGKPDTKTEE